MKIFFKPNMMDQLNKAIKDALDHNKVIDFIQLTQEEFDQLALEMSALNWKPDPENPGQFKYKDIPLIVEPIVRLDDKPFSGKCGSCDRPIGQCMCVFSVGPKKRGLR